MGEIFDKLMGSEIVGRKAFSDALNEATIKQCRLTSFILEITPVCNFGCKMCYARYTPDEVAAMGKKVLGFEDWKYYIDSFANMGALTCTFTGGECTLHPDFLKIYSYAYSKGLIMTVMTNGSNITDDILDLFSKMPPDKIMLTIYGASSETYGKMCCNAPAYKKVRQNIDRLLEAKHNVIAQFTVSKDNVYDMEKVYRYTVEKGLEFRYSKLLMNFDKCSAKNRSDNEAGDEEYDRIHRIIWCERSGRTPDDIDVIRNSVVKSFAATKKEVIEKGMSCNAGRNSCYINWKGEMTPCVSFDVFAKDPHESSVEECWRELVAWADKIPRLTECVNCIHRIHCNMCMAYHYNDTGVFGKPSPRICWKLLHPEEAAKNEAKYLKHE